MNRSITRRRLYEGIAIFCFYLFFSFLYHVTLYANRGAFYTEGKLGFLGLRQYWGTAGMQYLLFFLASIPVWFLIFRILRKNSLWIRMGVLGVLLIPLLYFIRFIHYSISDAIGWNHLQGSGSVWDLYIPGLFLLIQFGFLFAYEHYLENQKKLKVEGELRQAALKSELSAIKAQLNPHFLYNVFNTINASVPAENEKTRKLIAELSDLFRYQLQATKEDFVPLREEIDFVKKYLALEKARFEDRLKVEFDVKDEILGKKVPPMILQPLVENSIKHGLSSLIDGGIIRISIFEEKQKLKFIIEDTGVGVENLDTIFNNGVGLTNTKKRLQKMYNSTMEISNNEPSGLRIIFSI